MQNKAVMSSLAKKTFKLALSVIYIFIALFLLIGFGQFIFGSITGEQLQTLSNKINDIGFYTQFIRWFFYIILFIYWDPIIRYFSKLKKWEQDVIDRALSSKRSSLIILICVELFIMQAIQVKLFQLFLG